MARSRTFPHSTRTSTSRFRKERASSVRFGSGRGRDSDAAPPWRRLMPLVLRGVAPFVALVSLLSCSDTANSRDGGAAGQRRESAYRANNRGVAFMEQFAYPQAVEAFRQA